MNKEEAIRVLEDNRPSVIFEDEDAQKRMAELCQAIDMAIEALSERPKGEWIKKQVFNPELDKYVPFIECSVCGYNPYYGGSEPKFNYCANCGARMEK